MSLFFAAFQLSQVTGTSTTVEELVTADCINLEERYQKGKGEDWGKITHIPNIRIFP